MKAFPYLTDYVNEAFVQEQKRLDYIFLRPILLVLSFFLRSFLFPFKFVFHRRAYGFEPRCIDGLLAFGMKYFASYDAVELIVRHVQIEPLLYRHLLGLPAPCSDPANPPRKFNGIDGDYNLNSLSEMVRNNLTIGHDHLSYEVVERFDKPTFLANLELIRQRLPEDHSLFSKMVMESTKASSLEWIGCTNVVIMIVLVITIFGDLETSVKALNSFGSDSIMLWAMKHLYANDPDILIDLDFYMQDDSNRGHFNTSVFFANPSLYLHNHIAFDEYAYHVLRQHPPGSTSISV